MQKLAQKGMKYVSDGGDERNICGKRKEENIEMEVMSEDKGGESKKPRIIIDKMVNDVTMMELNNEVAEVVIQPREQQMIGVAWNYRERPRA